MTTATTQPPAIVRLISDAVADIASNRDGYTQYVSPEALVVWPLIGDTWAEPVGVNVHNGAWQIETPLTGTPDASVSICGDALVAMLELVRTVCPDADEIDYVDVYAGDSGPQPIED